MHLIIRKYSFYPSFPGLLVAKPAYPQFLHSIHLSFDAHGRSWADVAEAWRQPRHIDFESFFPQRFFSLACFCHLLQPVSLKHGDNHPEVSIDTFAIELASKRKPIGSLQPSSQSHHVIPCQPQRLRPRLCCQLLIAWACEHLFAFLIAILSGKRQAGGWAHSLLTRLHPHWEGKTDVSSENRSVMLGCLVCRAVLTEAWLIDAHWHVLAPCACHCFPLIAFPLSVRILSRKRSVQREPAICCWHTSGPKPR